MATTTQNRGSIDSTQFDRFIKIIMRILHLFVHSNVHVSFTILALTISTDLMIGRFNSGFYFQAFTFFATLLIYPLHRLVGIEITPKSEYTSAQQCVNKRPYLARVCTLAGTIGTFYFIGKVDISIMRWLIPLGLLTMAYIFPLTPYMDKQRRLRDLPIIKIYLITILTTLITSTLPLLLHATLSPIDIIILGVQRFLFVWAITLPFDIRDIHIDRKLNLQTIPLIIGVKASIRLSKTILLIAALLVFFAYIYRDLLSLSLTCAILISYLWASYVINKYQQYKDPLFNAFTLEGTMVIQCILIAITYIAN